MTVGDFLQSATKTLQTAGVETARLDALVMLESVLEVNRAFLLAHPERPLTSQEQASLNTFITQRKTHLPLAYIRGQAPFYGRIFYVNTDTLVPRPETEEMIARLLALSPHLPVPASIVDVGTGSGCLGITAKLELPSSEVTLADISPAALVIAQKNAAAHRVRVNIVVSDLLDSVTATPDVVLANLPYVPTDYPVNQAASHEPPLALFSGGDGLDAYRRFWTQVGHLLPAYVITEALPQQQAALSALATAHGYQATYTGTFVAEFTRNRNTS